MTEPRLLTQVEIAEQLGITEQAVWNWSKRYNDWPAPVQQNRRTKLYDAKDISAFLKRRNLPDETRMLKNR